MKKGKRVCTQCNKATEGHCCRPPDNRPTHAKRGYDRAWQRLRDEVIKQQPLCSQCLEQGKTTLTKIIDHITPWQSGATEQEREYLRLEPLNLQPLCQAHHNAKTNAERAAQQALTGSPERCCVSSGSQCKSCNARSEIAPLESERAEV